ncbi:MAG TPA: hypothetical protein VI876_09280 [Dehalococcoidia bacterium]|nr:hypothetical protein [Dehalococcoidia bacterium]
MSKRERAILQAAEEYAQEIKKRFPGATTEVLLESFDGLDAWIRVELPPPLHKHHSGVMDLTAELNALYDDRQIHLIATVEEVEEVAAHG